MTQIVSEMKDWQFGIDIDELKSFADIFKRRHGPHIYGAFGRTNEAAVAKSMHENSFMTNSAASLIYHTLESGSTHKTYGGREISLRAGETIVSSFACDDVDVGKLLIQRLISTLPSSKHDDGFFSEDSGFPVVWAEIFEEDQLSKTAVEDSGFMYVGTKILAGSEIKGLYVLGRPVESKDDPAELTTLSVLEEGFCTDSTRAEILNEVEKFGGWAQHYSSYNKGKSWTAFAIRGFVPNDPTFIIKPSEMSRKWKLENVSLLENSCSDTVAAVNFPKLLELVSRIPGFREGDAERVRLMRLSPGGGELTRHADITNRDAGVADGCLARLHIPLVTNPQVIMTQWNHRGTKVVGHFDVGDLCYLDQRQPHTVVNGGATERIHLVVDMKSNSKLREKISAGSLV